MIHVYPTNEARRHQLQGTTCDCGVRVDWDEAEAIVVHESFTGDNRVTPWTCDPNCDSEQDETANGSM